MAPFHQSRLKKNHSTRTASTSQVLASTLISETWQNQSHWHHILAVVQTSRSEESLRSWNLIYVEFGWSAAWWPAPIVVLWPETICSDRTKIMKWLSAVLGCNSLSLSITLGPKCNCAMHKHGIVYSCNGTPMHFISVSRSSTAVYVWWQPNQLVETTNQAGKVFGGCSLFLLRNS
jgi:hypothetical protein